MYPKSSYIHQTLTNIKEKAPLLLEELWGERPGSNRRPLEPQSSALTSWATITVLRCSQNAALHEFAQKLRDHKRMQSYFIFWFFEKKTQNFSFVKTVTSLSKTSINKTTV